MLEIMVEINMAKKKCHLFSIKWMGFDLLILSLILGILGTISSNQITNINNLFTTIFNNFYANISSELLGISLTVLFINKIYSDKELETLKEKSKKGLASKDKHLALEALGNITTNQWHTDGSLSGCDLFEAEIDHVELNKVDLSRANLLGGSFIGSFLLNGKFSEAILIRCNFDEAKLSGSNMERAYLTQASFCMARLNRVNFSRAIMHEAKFTGAYMIGANLLGAIGLEDSQLSDVCALRGTILPDGTLYLGERNLPGDMEDAKLEGIDISDKDQLQNWYFNYKEGQLM